jgi:predicted HicB family RNase H-like nuclease
MMAYKGYLGQVEFDDEAGLFHGEVVGTRDVITFQGRTVDELRAAFRDSVDDYLDWCAERGKMPDRPYSGRFVLRIDPALHRRLDLAARRRGKSVNAFIGQALEQLVEAD